MNSKADAVIVLGASVLADGTPSRALKRRVLTGVRALQEGKADVLIVSGGPLKNLTPEAVVMADLARDNGVSDEVLFVEPQALNTLENAEFSAALMKESGMKTALVVTDSWHMERALWCFGHCHIDAEEYCVPETFYPDPFWRRTGNRFREALAKEKYRWMLVWKRVQPIK